MVVQSRPSSTAARIGSCSSRRLVRLSSNTLHTDSKSRSNILCKRNKSKPTVATSFVSPRLSVLWVNNTVLDPRTVIRPIRYDRQDQTFCVCSTRSTSSEDRNISGNNFTSLIFCVSLLYSLRDDFYEG